MKLEIGKTYRTRAGHDVKIVEIDGETAFGIWLTVDGSDGAQGAFDATDGTSIWRNNTSGDIVSEVTP